MKDIVAYIQRPRLRGESGTLYSTIHEVCMSRIVWLSIVLPLTAGCVQRTMTITSEPPGALVYMNNQEIGRTPLKRDFTWYGVYDVQLRKEGYETLNTKAMIIAPIWQWPPWDLLAELWPWAKDRRHLAYTLKPASTQPVDTAVLLARSEDLRAKLQSSRYTHAPTTIPATNPR